MAYINTRDVIGDQATLDGLVAHTLTEFTEDGINVLAMQALKSNSGLTSVAFPHVSSISTSGMADCINLTTAVFSSLAYVNSHAFAYCIKLESVYAPIITGCGQEAFYSCFSLASINFPMMSNIGNYAFKFCYALSEISLSTTLNSIPLDAFAFCSSLKSINFQNVTNIGQSAFTGCSALSYVSLPKAARISSFAFWGCPISQLVLPMAWSIYSHITDYAYKVDIGAQASSDIAIGQKAFDVNYRLFALLLRSSSMATLQHINAFESTPISAGYGKIYVPNDLVSDYRIGTNWATYASQIESLDNYTDGGPTSGDSITDTWGEILASEDNGTYNTKYSLGDTKWLYTPFGYVQMQIIAMDTDELADETGNAKITWLCKGYVDLYGMNNSNTTAGGWESCDLRTYLREEVLSGIDPVVRNAIQEVKKTYSDFASNTTKTCTDTIWIPSSREVGSSYGVEDSGCVYTNFFTSDESREKYKLWSSFDRLGWRLRSARSSYEFAYVTAIGGFYFIDAITRSGLVFGFCT